MPKLSKLKKKSNVTNIFWFKVEGWYFQTPTELAISSGQPMKAHVSDQSLNESIVMSYYIIAAVNHHQAADLISFHTHNNRLSLANQKPSTTASRAAKMFGM